MLSYKNIITLIIVTSVIIVACTTKAEESKSDEIITTVKTAKVVEEKLSFPIHTSGVLSNNSEQKLSFKIPGIIKFINVKEGQQVKKGQILASLNLSEINAQVNQAKEGFNKAERDYYRAKKLYEENVVTLEQLQNAETGLNVAKAQLEIATYNKDHSIIKAPTNGRILKKFAEQNELINAGYPLFVFGSQSKAWKIKAGISDKDIIKLKLGDKAELIFDAYPNKKFTATVTEIGESAHPMNGTYEVELQLEKSELKLASGFVAKIDIFPSNKTAYKVLPIEALVEAEKNEASIFIVKNLIAEKQNIKIEKIFEDKVALNNSVIIAGEVVTEGSSYLSNGSKLNIVQ